MAFVFGEVDPVAIVATGTIIRGTPHPSSDLDLYVIHEPPRRRRIQRFFGDHVPTEIFINPPDAVRGYFTEEHDSGRPITAHMLTTGHVVFEQGSVLTDLRDEARSWLERSSACDEAALTRARYAAASTYEDATDVAKTDQETARMLLFRAVTAMLELWCRQKTGSIPRPKDLLDTAARLDAGGGTLARQVFTAAAFPEQERAAAALARLMDNPCGFFEWDSGFSPVVPASGSTLSRPGE